MRMASAALWAAMALSSNIAWADVGAKDIQVVAKTFGFTTPPLTGTVKVAVVYDASAAQSKAEAESVKTMLGTGLAAGQATLIPVMVPLDQLDSGLDGATVVFLTGGLSSQFDRIFTATKTKKLLSISTDTACVQTGKCVMGVRSEPKVEILINKAAAEASSVTFAPAFRMMISEI